MANRVWIVFVLLACSTAWASGGATDVIGRMDCGPALLNEAGMDKWRQIQNFANTIKKAPTLESYAKLCVDLIEWQEAFPIGLIEVPETQANCMSSQEAALQLLGEVASVLQQGMSPVDDALTAEWLEKVRREIARQGLPAAERVSRVFLRGRDAYLILSILAEGYIESGELHSALRLIENSLSRVPHTISGMEFRERLIKKKANVLEALKGSFHPENPAPRLEITASTLSEPASICRTDWDFRWCFQKQGVLFGKQTAYYRGRIYVAGISGPHPSQYSLWVLDAETGCALVDPEGVPFANGSPYWITLPSTVLRIRSGMVQFGPVPSLFSFDLDGNPMRAQQASSDLLAEQGFPELAEIYRLFDMNLKDDAAARAKGRASFKVWLKGSDLAKKSLLPYLFLMDQEVPWQLRSFAGGELSARISESLALSSDLFMLGISDNYFAVWIGKVLQARAMFGPGVLDLLRSTQSPNPAVRRQSLHALKFAPQSSAQEIYPVAIAHVNDPDSTTRRFAFDLLLQFVFWDDALNLLEGAMSDPNIYRERIRLVVGFSETPGSAYIRKFGHALVSSLRSMDEGLYGTIKSFAHQHPKEMKSILIGALSGASSEVRSQILELLATPWDETKKIELSERGDYEVLFQIALNDHEPGNRYWATVLVSQQSRATAFSPNPGALIRAIRGLTPEHRYVIFDDHYRDIWNGAYRESLFDVTLEALADSDEDLREFGQEKLKTFQTRREVLWAFRGAINDARSAGDTTRAWRLSVARDRYENSPPVPKRD